MRTLKRNKQNMWYSIPTGKEPIYVRDENGEIVYTEDGIPLDTGEMQQTYSEAVQFKGYIGSQLKDALARAWGSDTSNNYAVLVLSKDARDENGELIDLPNGSLIWRLNEPTEAFDNAEYLVDGVMNEELNENSYYLRKQR